MPKTTKKAERAALDKDRRKIRRKLRAKRRAKSSLDRKNAKTHPHRRTAALR